MQTHKTCEITTTSSLWAYLALKQNSSHSLPLAGVVAEEAAICAKDEQLNQVHWRLILLSRQAAPTKTVCFCSSCAGFGWLLIFLARLTRLSRGPARPSTKLTMVAYMHVSVQRSGPTLSALRHKTPGHLKMTSLQQENAGFRCTPPAIPNDSNA